MRLVLKSVLFLCVIIFVSGVDGWSRTIKGVNFPETISISGTSSKLVGVGIRKKLIISVYAGALYMSSPTTNDSNVIKSDQTKRISMQFIYKEVTSEQLIEAWNDGFKANAASSLNALKSKIDTFNGYFTESVRKGDTIFLTYIPGKGTEVAIKNRVKGIIEGKDFMEALFSIWFGPNPPTEGLKSGILGK
ncbi:chalcone isomerase family protein [Candidatus Latescibacterota bacterium]